MTILTTNKIWSSLYSNRKLLGDALVLLVGNVALYYTLKLLLSSSSSGGKIKRPKFGAQQLTRDSNKESLDAMKIMNDKLKLMKLSEHEITIASEIITLVGEDIPGFKQIGGLEDITSSLLETIIIPLKFCKNKNNNLLSPPKGVLFYGPPGCGKTMLARALAKESKATFINLHISTLTEKWFGESQKLVNALFTLSRKLQPTIIFIDEIDSFLRTRRSEDHETTNMMKAEFFTLWDGLNSSETDRIIVIGATNRPEDLDEAVLRRLSKKYFIKLPNEKQRFKILKMMLNKTILDSNFNFNIISIKSAGYSGSDLKELCRSAAMVPFREFLKETNININDISEIPDDTELRPLCTNDFIEILDQITTTSSNYNSNNKNNVEEEEEEE